jgi:superfamily II DNA or RNA helicase
VGVLYSDRKEPLPGRTNVTTYAQLERCPPATWAGLARAPLIFADEAHHTLTIERFRLLENRFSPEALRVALTATPDYDEVRALCRFFPRLIHELPLEDALDLGLMAPLRVWVLEVDADASSVWSCRASSWSRKAWPDRRLKACSWCGVPRWVNDDFGGRSDPL